MIRVAKTKLFGPHDDGCLTPCRKARNLDPVAGGELQRASLGLAVQKVRFANEARNEAVFRVDVDLFCGADLLDLARAHHGDPVGHGQGFFLVVGHEDEGDPGFKLQPLQLDLHFLAQLQVQRRQGFIEEEDLRLRGQRTCQRHALLLAAGKLAGSAPGHGVKLHQGQHLGCAGLHLGGGAAQHLQPEGHVLRDSEVWEKRIALEHRVDRTAVRRQRGDVGAIQQDRPARGHLEPRNQAQKRGLAAA